MKPSSDPAMPRRNAPTPHPREMGVGRGRGANSMKTLALAATALLFGVARMFGQSAPAPSGAAAQSPPSSASQTSPELPGAAPLRVMVGKSLLINTTERLKRVSVTDPSVADALAVTPTQVLVHGRSPGEVSLLIWDE